MAQKKAAEHQQGQDGYEEELAAYEAELADYLQARIKPKLSRSAIPLLARSIAKDIARQEPPEPAAAADSSEADSADAADSAESEESSDVDDSPEGENGPVEDFEADMHELQEELGDEWILRFSVHGEDAWLTAEKQDASQRVEAADADHLVKIVEAMDAD